MLAKWVVFDIVRSMNSLHEHFESAKYMIDRGLDYTNKLKDAEQELTERAVDLRDILTIPSLVSLSGLALVIHGSQRIDTLSGVNEVAAGRSFDLFDGFLARAFDQESDMGIILDPVSDKIGMGFIVAHSWKKNAVPKEALSVIIASNVLNAGFSLGAAYRDPHQRQRPPRSGKQAMAFYNAGLISYAYSHALELEHPDMHFHEPLRVLGMGAIVAGTGLAIPAAVTYVSRAFESKQS